MKRIGVFLLAMVCCLSLCGCGIVDSITGKSDKEAAKAAYKQLVSVEESCVGVMEGVHSAWNFAIEKADIYTNAGACFEAYIAETGLPYSDALDIMNAEIRNKGIEVTGTSQIEYLSDINTSVDLVLIWCEENEIFDSWDVGMKNAQELINSADVRFELIEYYKELLTCIEFVKNPAVSFDEFEAFKDKHKEELREYRIDMQLELG